MARSDFVDDPSGSNPKSHWRAQQVNEFGAEITEKYVKPSGGIPTTDIAEGAVTAAKLAAAVAADIASRYIKPSGGIPATDIAAAVLADIASRYIKPSGGIPATDIAAAVLADIASRYIKPGSGVPTADIAAGAITLDRLAAAVASQLMPVVSIPTIIAHRGLGDLWNGYANGPLGGVEETEYSIDAAYSAGVPSVEVHTQLLSDGTVAAIHDSTVNRTTNGTGNVSDFNIAAYKTLVITTTQAGYNLTLPVTLQPATLREVLARWGGRHHVAIEATGPAVTAPIIAMLQDMGLTKAVTGTAFTVFKCQLFAAAGIDTMYLPPNLGQANSDASTILAQDCWPAGGVKRVGINYQPSNTVSVTTTNASAAVTAASGLSAVNGWNVSGTGIPYGTTISSSSDTAGTLSANATASGTVTLTFWPTQAQMVTYIGTLIAAGLEVTAYVVNQRSDKTWLAAAGVVRFYTGEPVYLGATAQIRASTSADPTSKGAWPHGRLISDPTLPAVTNLGRGNIANGGQALDKDLGGSREMHCCLGDVAFLGTIPATYSIKTDFTFQTMPTDTTRFLELSFCRPDDAPSSGNTTFGSGIRNGYVALVRANGQLQLFKTTRTAGTTTQLGTTQTMSTLPTAAAVFRLVISITATGITVSVKDITETTTYATLTVTDSTYRGGYIFIGKAQNSTNVWSAVFKNVTVG